MREDVRLVLRKLWTEHVLWTRVAIISALAGLADTQTAIDRLMRNQDEIGSVAQLFLGVDAGKHLAALLRDHIRAAVDAVTAAKDRETSSLESAAGRLYANADGIARFLSATGRWPYATIAEMLRVHIDQLLAETAARVRGDWNGDVAATDASLDHILVLADALAAGF
jgi:hypothetical protein